MKAQSQINRWSFAYTPASGRDARLDWLRGYCLFMMIVDHVGSITGKVAGTSWLYALTGGTWYYTSAAEAFYFISGVTLGLIASRETARESTRRVLTRTWHLYRTSLMLSFFFGAIALYTSLAYFGRWSFGSTQPLEYALHTLILRAQTGGAGILVLYVVFMLVTPLALWLFRLRLTWVVLVASVLTFTVGQIVPETRKLPLAVYFQPFAWQVLFFGGLTLGFHRTALIGFFSSRARLRAVLEGLTVGLALVFLLIHVTGYRVWPGLPELFRPMELMPPMRLVLATLAMLAAYILCSWFWKPLQSALGWLLEPLGRASLWSFCMHMFVILLVWNLPWFRATPDLLWLWQAVAVLLVWLSLRLRDVLVRWQSAEARPARLEVKT